jgi:glycosyltransferase involved in cell wall biosynthesis
MKYVGVYDKWLNTYGGGEKVATVMVENLLRGGYRVDLISNTEIDRKEIEDKMGVNLKGVNMVFWSERSYEKLTLLTKKYDVFVNTSYFDHLPSLAKKSIYYVHFPTPIRRTFFGFIKYETVLPFLRRFLIIPEVIKGLSQIDEIVVRGGKWLSRENAFVISNPPLEFNIKLRFYAEKLNIRALESLSFKSDNAELVLKDKYIDHQNNVLTYDLKVVMFKKENLLLRMNTSEKSNENALGLVSLTIRDIRYLIWNFIKRYLPTYEMALYGSASYKIAQGLDTYNVFFTNSNFTKKWTKKYWGKNSLVLYPPVDIEKLQFQNIKKKNIILNVGRFFVGGHSKRQDVLLDAFIKMYKTGQVAKNWELHFVGGVASGDEHRDYLNSLIDTAKGYPVFFHISVEFTELVKLFSAAKIYWHATGYGVNERKDPIKMEHFGITPVEAMAAGCVPVVYRGGGLSETVGDASGLMWKSVNDLTDITIDLMKNNFRLEKLSKLYTKMAKNYSVDRFGENFLGVVERLINKDEN